MDVRDAKPGLEGQLTSLVFPTFNAARQIEATWRSVRAFLNRVSTPWEILFVCDGCTDGTDEALAELTAGVPMVRVLSYTPNRGKGHAVRRGLEAARGEYRLFADVDLAYDWTQIVKVADALWNGADLAIASRTHKDSRVIVPSALLGYAYWRQLQSQVFARFVQALLPISVSDTQAGLKGMNARVARATLSSLECEGFGFDCELLTTCSRAGWLVEEVPVSVQYTDDASTTSLLQTGRMIRDLWRIRRNLRGRPAPAPVGIAAAPAQKAA